MASGQLLKQSLLFLRIVAVVKILHDDLLCRVVVILSIQILQLHPKFSLTLVGEHHGFSLGFPHPFPRKLHLAHSSGHGVFRPWSTCPTLLLLLLILVAFVICGFYRIVQCRVKLGLLRVTTGRPDVPSAHLAH